MLLKINVLFFQYGENVFLVSKRRFICLLNLSCVNSYYRKLTFAFFFHPRGKHHRFYSDGEFLWLFSTRAVHHERVFNVFSFQLCIMVLVCISQELQSWNAQFP